MADYWFFASYASNDRVAELRQFFEWDLPFEVRRLASLPSTAALHDVGFFDRSGLEHGEAWATALVDALRSSRTYLPMVTNSLLGSRNCAKELGLFLARVEAWSEERPGTPQPRLVLPLSWDPPGWLADKLPPVLSGLQDAAEDAGALYAQEGLRGLMLDPAKSDYKRFVARLAKRIVDSGTAVRLPRLLAAPAFDDAPEAWQRGLPSRARTAAGTTAPVVAVDDGPVANFVFVAGRRSELVRVRTRVDGYGADAGWRWQPFLPESQVIGPLASRVAAAEGLLPNTLPFPADLVTVVREAERKNQIVIIVVDPWTACLDEYRQLLQAYDEVNVINSTVIVPWNTVDDELPGSESKLREALRTAFRRVRVLDASRLRDDIHNCDEFAEALVAAFADIRSRLMQFAVVPSPWGGEDPGELPLPSGPGVRV